MLCQHCQSELATFHYQENINGQKKEWHLCSGCAKKNETFFSERRKTTLRAMHSLFSESFIPTAISLAEPCEEQRPQKVSPIAKPDPKPKALEDFTIEELQAQMQAYVREENYEKAARVRDILNEKLNKNQEGE